ncbi:FIST N-terminal domain-containing protein [Pseudogemmobacter sp. W21_MBD1_M6]|uniref:FIST N-terminal domain-containing protein n=1 Tax=Pseudogemmobacter sp. W21_MBD1_M6 TaxID=3240271 RepID=UPI003F94D687
MTIFLSPAYFRPDTAQAINTIFGSTPVIGCTTAGEITPLGVKDGHMVAVGFPDNCFCAATRFVVEPRTTRDPSMTEVVLEQLNEVARKQPDWGNEFAFLLNDGLARNEDRVVSLVNPALGMVPLFGGSAGDGLSFKETAVFANGQFHQHASLLTVFRTRCPIKVFRFDHFGPTATRMVVTRADPEKRLVSEINAEPAAAEYARMVGKDPGQLSPFVFAASPVMVQVGGQYHVRAIQKVEDNGDLRFFSAIDEGLVLTVAKSEDIVLHLERELAKLSQNGRPDAIVACECILRKLEIDQRQAKRKISAIMTDYNVIGFNTYGEQFNMLHVNQTFTGVAIYPPAAIDD